LAIGLGDLEGAGATGFFDATAGLFTFTQISFFPDLEHRKFCCETFAF
jgi:hypothetical protein